MISERWVEDRIDLDERLIRALKTGGYGGSVQLLQGLEKFAEQLGFHCDRLEDEAYELLENLISAVEASVISKGIGRFDDDLLYERYSAIAKKALDQYPLSAMLEAAEQLGWSNARIKEGLAIRDVESAVRDILEKKLAEAVRRMFYHWQKTQAWPAGLDLHSKS